MPETSKAAPSLLTFADLRLDVGQRRLSRNGRTLKISKLSFDFLRVLAEAAPNLVDHEELIERVWGSNRIVTPENLAKRVLLLRNALGDDAAAPRYIEVVRGQGLRLIPPVTTKTHSGPARNGRERESDPRWRLAAVLAVAIASTIAAVAFLPVPDGPAPPAMRNAGAVRFELSPTVDKPLALSTYSRGLAISPDGARVAYQSKDNSLVVRRLNDIESARLEDLGTELRLPVFSTDGSRIAFMAGTQLRTASADGTGPIETILSIEQGTDGDLRWEPDGTFLLASAAGVRRIRPDGSSAVLLRPDHTKDQRSFNAPTLLPDGRSLLMSVEPVRPETGSSVVIANLDTGDIHPLLSNATQPVYLQSGYLLFVREGRLRAARFDFETRKIGVQQAVLAENVMVNTNGTAQFSVAENGAMIYAVGTAPRASKLVWLGRDGTETALPIPPMNVTYPRISPDGRYIALDARWPDSDIWLWDNGRSLLTRVTNNAAENVLPAWSRDGSTLYFGDGRSGVTNAYGQRIDGSGEAFRLTASPRRQLPFAVAGDDDNLILGEADSNGSWQLYAYRRGWSEARPLLAGGYSYWNPDVSPDGHWLVYQSDESGSLQVHVRPFPDVGSGHWQISAAGGSKPMWGRDGTEILFLDPELKLMRAAIVLEPDFEAATPAPILDMSKYRRSQYEVGARPYDLSPDGKRILFLEDEVGAEQVPRIVVSVNWTGELAAAEW